MIAEVIIAEWDGEPEAPHGDGVLVGDEERQLERRRRAVFGGAEEVFLVVPECHDETYTQHVACHASAS